MQINSIDNINFNGGFRFKNMPAELKETLPEFIKNKRQIFYNFDNTGDVFYAVRNSADFKVMRMIQKNNLNFEYYPQISTKSGLDTEKPEGLTKLLKRFKDKAITSKTQLKKAVMANIQADKVKPLNDDNINKILNVLKLDFKEYKTSSNPNGCKIITAKNTDKRVLISPPSRNNINYVLVEPKSYDNNVERYAIADDGQILARFCTPEQITQFKKNFKSTLLKNP